MCIALAGLAAGGLSASGVYWTTWNLGMSDGLYRAGRDGGDVTQLFPEEALTAPDYSYIISLPMDLAVDEDSGTLYLIETGFDTIWRTDFAGSDFHEVIAIEGEDPHQMEIDWNSRMIYWIEDNGSEAPARLGRCTLDGEAPTYLVDDAGSRAGGIALDAAQGYLFWTETHAFTEPTALAVWRCKLDGSEAQAIVSEFPPDTFELGSIAVDPEAAKVYWIQDQALVKRADYDGSNVETLFEDASLGDRSHLAIDTTSGELFWTSLEEQLIGRATLDGSVVGPFIQDLPSSPFGVAVVSGDSGDDPGPPINLAGRGDDTLIVQWDASSPDWILEQSSMLLPGSWEEVSADRITVEGTDATAEIDLTGPQGFLRLRQVNP
jgi:hypothetical protein